MLIFAYLPYALAEGIKLSGKDWHSYIAVQGFVKVYKSAFLSQIGNNYLYVPLFQFKKIEMYIEWIIYKKSRRSCQFVLNKMIINFNLHCQFRDFNDNLQVNGSYS